jgi:hypothetical protein
MRTHIKYEDTEYEDTEERGKEKARKNAKWNNRLRSQRVLE